MSDLDHAIARVRLKALGRTNYVGRPSFDDESLLAEIERLRTELAAAEARGIAVGRAQMREGAAQVAEWSHMALPDGGSPTVEEREVAEEAARRIRALPVKQHVAFEAESKACPIAAERERAARIAETYDPPSDFEAEAFLAAATMGDLIAERIRSGRSLPHDPIKGDEGRGG